MRIELNFPETKIGEYSIESFEFDGIKYQKLWKGDFLIMENTPKLIATYVDFLNKAEGDILINGLGMGLCCKYLLEKSTVKTITIVELEKGIIDIIKPNFDDDRLTFIHGSAFDFIPPSDVIYDFVWHDIWFYYTSKNLIEMKTLFDKYQNVAKWQGAWNEDKCLELKIKENI